MKGQTVNEMVTQELVDRVIPEIEQAFSRSVAGDQHTREEAADRCAVCAAWYAALDAVREAAK